MSITAHASQIRHGNHPVNIAVHLKQNEANNVQGSKDCINKSKEATYLVMRHQFPFTCLRRDRSL